MRKIVLILLMLSLISCKEEVFRLSKLSLKLAKDKEDLDFPTDSKFHVLITEGRTYQTYETYMNYEDIVEFDLPNGHYDILIENIDCFEQLYFYNLLIDKVLSSDELVEVKLELVSCFEEE